MGLQVELKQLVGTVVGGNVTDQSAQLAHDTDEIRILDVNGVSKRVGFCPHADGASVRFVRILTDEQRSEIVSAVAEHRKTRGLATDARSSQPPDPAEIRAALKKERRG